MLAAGVGEGDIVVTSSISFLSSANCARFVGAEVRFTDVEETTGLMTPEELEKILRADKEKKIKVVIPVHFAGQPVDVAEISKLAHAHGALVVDDACHALGAEFEDDGKNFRIGGTPYTDMTVFSFHPVKHVAMGEGGAVVTAEKKWEERLRRFRNHGMRKEDFAFPGMAFAPDGSVNPWYYEMHELGFNYRITDIQAALGIRQLERLDWSLLNRRRIASNYTRLLAESFDDKQVKPLETKPHRTHAYHLFVVLIDFDAFQLSRATVMNRLREMGIGTQMHYIPIPLQPYYRARYGTQPGDFPHAEQYYSHALSLPMYPDLTEEDCKRVVESLKVALGK